MIQRYELELYDTEAGYDFHKSDNGDLCKYEDAQKLEQENAQLKKINGNMNHGMAKDILKIAKLEQENERLRALVVDMAEAAFNEGFNEMGNSWDDFKRYKVDEALKETGE